MRARTKLVAESIVDVVRQSSNKLIRVCSVGSGAAIDVELACRELSLIERGKIEVTLLDIDPDALVHAEQRLSPLLAREQLHLQRENLFRLPRLNRTKSVLGDADFISCTGLFDYLPNDDAIAMLRCFWSCLKADGEMMLFNFALQP